MYYIDMQTSHKCDSPYLPTSDNWALHHHHEASKRSRNELLKQDKEDRDDQPWSCTRPHQQQWGLHFLFCTEKASDYHGTTESSTQWSHSTSFCKRLQCRQQQIDCNKHMRLHKQQPNFFINVDQPHWWLQGATCQQEDWSQGHNVNVGNATIISYCHIARSNDNNRWMQGKFEQTPMQQSKFYVAICKMQRWPYRAMQQSVAQICQGWVWQVCRRQIVHCQRHVCCQRQVHWVQRCCVRCGVRVWQVHQRRSHPSRRATTSLFPKMATTNSLPRMVTGWVQWWAPYHKGNWSCTPCKTTTSLLPQGWVTVYVMPGHNKPH